MQAKPSISYFPEDLSQSQARRGQEAVAVAEMVASIRPFRILEDVGDSEYGRRKNIDWRFKWDLESFDVEVKFNADKILAQHHILTEVWSSIEEHKPGWLYKSTADYLAYLWMDKTSHRLTGYFLHFPNFRRHYLGNQGTIENRRMITKANRTYTTGYYPVPVADLGNDIVVFPPPPGYSQSENCIVCDRGRFE